LCAKNNTTISIKEYNEVWKDLRVYSKQWKRVWMPTLSVFDMGVSEAIYSSVKREIIYERTSPIVYMRAQKNEVERNGMRNCHVRDAVALCDTLSYLEERVINN
jgi:Xaa-Pro aminopeptidase